MQFGMQHFVFYLSSYLAKLAVGHAKKLRIASTPLHEDSRLAVYKQFKVQLSPMRQVDVNTSLIDIIHALPEHAGQWPTSPPLPPNMSTVLIQEQSPSAGN